MKINTEVKHMIEKIRRQKILMLFIFIICLTATTWSLYLSKGLGLTPCELCWYQRILMYPIVLISSLGILKKNINFSSSLTLILSGMGVLISGYHSYIQIGPKEAGFCNASTSCSAVLYQFYGLSVPNLSFIAFLMILVLSVIIKTQKEKI